MAGALDREFALLSDQSTGIVTEWASRHEALRGCRDLHDVVSAMPAAPDRVLAALMVEVGEGCSIAPRVVLQAMIPKMIRFAGVDPVAGVSDYLAHLWLRITTYPLDRRPTSIAGNLALDTLKAVKAEQAPRPVPVDDLHECTPSPPDELSARRLLRAAAELRLIDPITHATMFSVYAEGLTEPETAVRHRVTATTVRRRCTRGIRTLAAHATVLAQAM